MEAVSSGPYATAFYGSEGHYVGERPIANLRRAVASRIAKPNKGLCPKIALLAYRGGRLDPRIELIIRACRMADIAAATRASSTCIVDEFCPWSTFSPRF